MTKDAQVAELVDDGRLERLGRGQDEPPAEGYPARSGGAPPAAAGIADDDDGRLDAQARSVTGGHRLDLDHRPAAQPGFEDPGRAASIAGRELDDDRARRTQHVGIFDPDDRASKRLA